MINIRQSFTRQTFVNDSFKDFPRQTFALYGTINSYSVNYSYCGSVADSGRHAISADHDTTLAGYT